MRNYLDAQRLIDRIMEECAATRISHEDLVYALMLTLYSDMKAFDDEEHQLTSRDGELLIHVRRFT